MAQNIGNITTSQTFENWFTKTNDLVTALATNVMTASTASPETTNGDAILTGSFTATNLVASTLLSTDTIGAVSGGAILAGAVRIAPPNIAPPNIAPSWVVLL